VFVADTSMKYSGKIENSAKTDRNA
jgi:hypothetical protein